MDIARNIKIQLIDTENNVDFIFKYTIPDDIQDSYKLGMTRFSKIFDNAFADFFFMTLEHRFKQGEHDMIVPSSQQLAKEDETFDIAMTGLMDKNMFLLENSATNTELLKYILIQGIEKGIKEGKVTTALSILTSNGIISVKDTTPQQDSSENILSAKRSYEDMSSSDYDDYDDNYPDEKKSCNEF